MKLIEKRTEDSGKTDEVISHRSLETHEVSTTIMEVYAGVLQAHLHSVQFGISGQQLIELLLRRILETNASVVVVYIVDVPIIDSEMAQRVISSIGTIQLLGTKVILAGKLPDITRAKAFLGNSHYDITIRSSLSAGLWVALDIRELQVSKQYQQR